MKIHDHVSSHHSFMYLWIIGAILVLAGLSYSYIGTHPNGIIDGEHEGDVRTTVAQFGNQLNSVSLQSPTAAEEIQAAYESYVTPELLSEWIANPLTAPGRITSSPWPDHIEVDTVVMNLQGSYDVTGRIMLSSSAGDAGIIPVLLTVTDVGGSFLISGYEENPGSATAPEQSAESIEQLIKDSTYFVSLGETVSSNGVSLTPLAIVEDSRCPKDVQCIQAGIVRVSARVTKGTYEETYTFILGEHMTFAGESILISFDNVMPDKFVSDPIEEREYRFSFRISTR